MFYKKLLNPHSFKSVSAKLSLILMAEKNHLEGAYYYLQRNGLKNIRYYMAHKPCNMDAEKDGAIYDILVLSSEEDFEVAWKTLEGLISIPSDVGNHRVLLFFSCNSGQCLFEMHNGRIFS
jgi:hypothetical protein